MIIIIGVVKEYIEQNDNKNRMFQEIYIYIYIYIYRTNQVWICMLPHSKPSWNIRRVRDKIKNWNQVPKQVQF
jgi:hypothetical protein